MHRKWWKRLLLALLSFVIVLGAAWQVWPNPRTAMYRLYREQSRVQTLDRLQGYERMRSDRFELYYTEADRAVADLVLETADSVFGAVTEQLGFTPTEPVPLILYASRQELQQAFGWGAKESALGVYWQGTVRLLSPRVWIRQQDVAKQAQAYRRLNPIAHELTHYVLDYLTNGNYPRWFTEGLAQRVEHKVTGYLWLEPSSTLDQPLYSLTDLTERFDALQNQPLAYRQSYLLVDYMAQTYGENVLTDIIERLANGLSFGKAVAEATGQPMERTYSDCQDWITENRERLEESS